MTQSLLHSKRPFPLGQKEHDFKTIIKFADDTAVVGLIIDYDETAYRDAVRDLVVRRQDNKLSLNVSKTKELIVHYRTRL